MFRRLRQALDDALSRLEARIGPGAEEDIDRLLAAMREELVETKARIPELEELVETLRRRRDDERKRAEDCVRRAGQAERVGDAETVEVAERFARQHLARVHVLEQKIEAARAELALKREEVEEMTSQLKDAMTRRDALGIQARRARAVDRTAGAGSDAVSEFDRLAERIERPSDVEAAERELDRELGLEPGAGRPGSDPGLDAMDREARADELLRELKRRMDVQDGD